MEWGSPIIPLKGSNWWKSLINLDKEVPGKNWLMESIRRKVGDEAKTPFWTSKWIGNVPLAMVFPKLFSLSNHKEGMVLDFVASGGDRLDWIFTWRRNLFQWEEDLVVGLRELLEVVVLNL
jgi:hypothetical protein